MAGFAFYKIKLYAGIGDCLRVLSMHKSLYSYNSSHGLQIFWIYKDDNAACKDYYTELLNDFILGRAGFFRNVSEEIYNSLECTELLSLDIHAKFLTFDNYSPYDKIGFPISMNFNERLQLTDIYTDTSKVKIVIQLFGGTDTKYYKQYNHVLKLILEKFPSCTIFLIGADNNTIDIDYLLLTVNIVNLIMI
jgi:hypothetical protein